MIIVFFNSIGLLFKILYEVNFIKIKSLVISLILVCLVMLSVGSAFAADNSTDDVISAADEITVDKEVLAVEQETQKVNLGGNSSPVVTNDTLFQYFDEYGEILANVTSDELIFEGIIENSNFNELTITHSITLTGNNVTLNGISLLIVSDNVTVSGFAINQKNNTDGIFISGSDVTIENTTVNFVDNGAPEGMAIRALNSQNLKLLNNIVNYVGNTDGSYINNGIYIINSNNSTIRGNKFNLSLVSSYVPWMEIPAGSGNWVAFPVSEGIVIDSSSDVKFVENTVDLYYNNVVGEYDTIYAVSFKNTNDTEILANNITALGHTYIYGLQVSGDMVVAASNRINVESDNYYANAIDIEGPAIGYVVSNILDVKGVESAYGIYSGMNGYNVSALYNNNTIYAEAYNVFGFSLGDIVSYVESNKLFLTGNYTTGIAYRGDYIKVSGNEIFLNSTEQGNLSVWEKFGVESVAIKVVKGNATIADNEISAQGKGVILTTEDTVNMSNNTIVLIAHEDADAYAIYAEYLSGLNITGNVVQYVGKTRGTGINNAVYVLNIDDAVIAENEFDLFLVSSYVPWFEIPAGSGNWVSFPVSEGIVIDSCNGVKFVNNSVNVNYTDVVGSYDTIYSVSVKNSDMASIEENNITALGHTYIYGIQISGRYFVMSDNTLNLESDNYYACGIDVEGPANGMITDNVVFVKGVISAYCIYSGMNGQNVSSVISDNFMYGSAYNAFGMSLGDIKTNVSSNQMGLVGNYTTGIAYRGNDLTAFDNTILVNGSNIGDLAIWEEFGVETIGIKVVMGESNINNNRIMASSAYAIDVKGNNASVHDNFLVAYKFVGDESVNNAANADVYNNTPVVNDTDKISTNIVITEVCGNGTVSGILTENGTPFKDSVFYSIGGINGTVNTDENGVFHIDNVPNGELVVTFLKDSYRLSSNATIVLKDIAPFREASVISSEDYTTYAIDYNAGERGNYFKIQLLDDNLNPLANKTVQIGFNGKVYTTVTNETGWAQLQINLAGAGTYTFAVAFLGDENYNASFVVQKIVVNKKKTTIDAPAKSYKASAKTKSYTVTLKTDKGSSIDGKTYMASGKKVTMTINGKTYTAKTNSKGQATFKLSITKKGTFSATVKFDGDKTYAASSKSAKITIK